MARKFEKTENQEEYYSTDAQEFYFHEALNEPLLTLTEELDLGKLVHEGRLAGKKLANSFKLNTSDKHRLENTVTLGLEAGDRLIRSNLRWVVNIASAYKRIGVSTDLMDMISDGNEGLIYAIREKYDYRRGYKCTTLATFWIHQKIKRSFANMFPVQRLPSHAFGEYRKILAHFHTLMEELEREPTVDELARSSKISKKKIDRFMYMMKTPISLDDPTRNPDVTFGDSLEDIFSPNPYETAAQNITHEKIQSLLETLDTKEAKVLSLRFGLKDGSPRTLEEVGQLLGLTRERIRQIEAGAIKKIRTNKSTMFLLRQLLDQS